MGSRRGHDEPYKRLACDRCHALKLRCMRKDGREAEGESCVRCHRASALCRYSPSERLGRPPDKSRLKNPPNPRIPSQKQRRREANAAIEWASTSPSGLEPPIPGTSLWGKQSTARSAMDDLLLTRSDDSDDMMEFSSSPPPSQGGVRFPLVDTRHRSSDWGRTGESNLEMLSCDNGHDLFESSTRGSSDDFDLDGSSLDFLAVDCYADTVRGDDGTTSQDFSLGMSTMFQETSIVPDKVSSRVAQDPTSSILSEPELMTNTNEGYVETMQRLPSSSSDAKEKCMGQLSDIIITLFHYLKAISSGSSVKESPPSPEAAPQDSLAAYHPGNITISIGDVFRISEEIIRILASFEPISGRNSRSPTAASRNPYVGVLPSPPSNAQPVSPVPLSSHNSPCLRRQNNSNSRSPCFSCSHPPVSIGSISSITPAGSVRYSNETTRTESPLSSNSCFPTDPHPLPKMKPSAVPSSSFKSSKLLQLDIPTMLLIMNCYSLLTRIYNAFFARCLRVLTKYPSAADRVLLPEILPCFDLGGFKPLNYGSLQMSIIVEASMHLIRKIEDYLERPDINQEGVTGPKGPVLQLMDFVMKADGLGHLRDGESPVQLRENVEAIKRLVKS